jgi:hypothetical protein
VPNAYALDALRTFHPEIVLRMNSSVRSRVSGMGAFFFHTEMEQTK